MRLPLVQRPTCLTPQQTGSTSSSTGSTSSSTGSIPAAPAPAAAPSSTGTGYGTCVYDCYPQPILPPLPPPQDMYAGATAAGAPALPQPLRHGAYQTVHVHDITSPDQLLRGPNKIVEHVPAVHVTVNGINPNDEGGNGETAQTSDNTNLGKSTKNVGKLPIPQASGPQPRDPAAAVGTGRGGGRGGRNRPPAAHRASPDQRPATAAIARPPPLLPCAVTRTIR